MISENLQDLNYESIILNEPIKNSAVQYNYFYKLLYSTHIVSLTSIFLLFELNNLSFENDKIKFDKTTLNNSVFSKLIELEEHVLISVSVELLLCNFSYLFLFLIFMQINYLSFDNF